MFSSLSSFLARTLSLYIVVFYVGFFLVLYTSLYLLILDDKIGFAHFVVDKLPLLTLCTLNGPPLAFLVAKEAFKLDFFECNMKGLASPTCILFA